MKNNLLSEQLAYTGDSKTQTHLHLCSYNVDEVRKISGERLEEVESEILPGGITWLQVHGFEDTECIREVCSHFGIDFLIVQDILNTELLSKIEVYDNYNLVLAKQIVGSHRTHIGIVQGSDFVLTFQEHETEFFDEVLRAIQSNVLKIRSRQSDYLFSVLLNGLMTNYIAVATAIWDRLEELESTLLSDGPLRDIGAQIQGLRREYMELKRTVWPLKDQYSRLLHSDTSLLHKGTRPFFNDVNDHLLYVVQDIDTCRETLSSLMDLYISNNDLRMNDIMKRLTIVATIFIPLTFLVGVWGMNFEYMPELKWRYGYCFAWIVIVVVGVLTFLLLRTKRWR